MISTSYNPTFENTSNKYSSYIDPKTSYRLAVSENTMSSAPMTNPNIDCTTVALTQ